MSEGAEAVINAKLDALTESLKRLEDAVTMQNRNQQQIEIWRERIEGRLTAGAEKMSRLELAQAGFVEKRVLLAYVIGAASAGGVTAASLIKVLGL